MNTLAVVLEEPEFLTLRELDLADPGEDDVVVDIEWSGISTGTERLLWRGLMPDFPGMGYPLVPGYESVGRVSCAGSRATLKPGQRVFVPGARCYKDVRGLFGGAASRVTVPAGKAVAVDEHLGEETVLLALAATACHAISARDAAAPDLIVGHGVLGRLIARLTLATFGEAPVVWERNPARRAGAAGYPVVDPDEDSRADYKSICDVSGDPSILDGLIARLAPGGEIVLAGFYDQRLSFAFPPAFMREARIRVAAEWRPRDLDTALRLIQSGRLELSGLITHRSPAKMARDAYRTAFDDPDCLKMVLDWRKPS
jgi:3-hydroxyethyl bacteriochlorophyllide a dehydrogenase